MNIMLEGVWISISYGQQGTEKTFWYKVDFVVMEFILTRVELHWSEVELVKTVLPSLFQWSCSEKNKNNIFTQRNIPDDSGCEWLKQESYLESWTPRTITKTN